MLAKVISQNFGNVRHQGKIPARGAGPLKIRREVLSLKKELEKAVMEENFEKAVELRDKIRALEKEIT
jgi:protein arginine kinase activator